MARGRQQGANNTTEVAQTKSRSLTRKRVEAANLAAFQNNNTYALSIIGIANSVELFKGEVGKGGTMQAVR